MHKPRIALAGAPTIHGIDNVHEHQRESHGERSRYPAQLVSRARQLVHLSRPYPEQLRELDHGSKLRLQRRRRSVHLHFRLHRGHDLRKNHAGTRLYRRGNPAVEARMAALCRLRRSVRDLHRGHRICSGTIRRARPSERIQRRRPDRPSDPNPGARPAAAIQGAQPRCAAALHLAGAAVPAGVVDDVALAYPDGARVACALSRRAPVRLEPGRRFRMATGISIRSAGNCCSC